MLTLDQKIFPLLPPLSYCRKKRLGFCITLTHHLFCPPLARTYPSPLPDYHPVAKQVLPHLTAVEAIAPTPPGTLLLLKQIGRHNYRFRTKMLPAVGVRVLLTIPQETYRFLS
jgi:hypothetical protein